jgi:hypothetical protein
MNNQFGFVVLRNVISEDTNDYWNLCVKQINLLYPSSKIIIIDDNSNPEYVKELFELKNVEVYHSKYKKRGELLPFLYFIENHWFENMIFIHDSCFIQKRIPFEKCIVNVMPLWHFKPDNESSEVIHYQLQHLSHSFELINLFSQKDLLLRNKTWYGIFGLMCFINYSFLTRINNKYKLYNLIPIIRNRQDRCSLERTLSILFYSENYFLQQKHSLLGNIFQYGKWNLTYKEFKEKNINLPIVKVWTGR